MSTKREQRKTVIKYPLTQIKELKIRQENSKSDKHNRTLVLSKEQTSPRPIRQYPFPV
jgi:hypothetical protein